MARNSMTNIIKYDARDELIQKVVYEISNDLRSALDSNKYITFAVPGGTTPGPILEKLSEVQLDWSRVKIILGDERWVPYSHERSNSKLIMETLLKNEASGAQFIPIYADFATPEEGILHINKDIEACLPLSIALLGMGADMHTASLFPGSINLKAALSIDAPTLVPISAPGISEPRVSLSARVFNSSQKKHVVFFGAEKRKVLDDALSLDPLSAPVRAILEGAIVHWAK